MMSPRASGVAEAGGQERQDEPPIQPEVGLDDCSGQLWIEDLYRQQSPRLLRSLSRRTTSLEDARDLVQDIFARIARLGRTHVASIERPEAYLGRMATNMLRDEARKATRRSVELHVVADENKLTGVDQQDLLEKRDMLRRLEAAMLKLKPKTRQIFLAHRIDGMSYAEIAQRTGLSIKGVEKQMAKAIAQIDRMLDRQGR